MASILDKIRSGATGLFSGPRIPGQQGQDPGAREGLISAGLATIIAANNGATLPEALAMGAQQGRGAGANARQEFANRQTREGLSQMLEQEGYNRDNLTSTAFQLLAAGDMEGAKGVFNILQSLPSAIAPATVNTRNVEMTVGEIRRQGGVVPEGLEDNAVMIVPENPRTLERQFDRATVRPPEEESEFDMYDPNSPTGKMRVRVVDGAIIPIAPAGDTGGGDTMSTERGLALGLYRSAKSAAEAMIENDLDEELTGVLINMGRRAGDTGFGDAWRWASNQATNDRSGLALTAALNFINPAVRFLTGAQMNESEASRYIVGLIPTTWDPPAVVAFKRRMRASLVDAMGTAGGNGDGWLESIDPMDAGRIEQLSLAQPGTSPDLGLTETADDLFIGIN